MDTLIDPTLVKQYQYTIMDVSEDGETAYQAVVPKFPGIYVFADTPEELPSLVREALEDVIRLYQKEGKSLPKPDRQSSYSGKFVLRVAPVVHERLVQLASASQTNLNQYVNRLIEDHLS